MGSFPLVFFEIPQLSRTHFSFLFDLAKQYKQGAKKSSFDTLSSAERPIVATLFLEDSSRTKYSFVQAAQKLGLHTYDFDVQSSSLKKGESVYETFQTLQHQGTDLVVIRTKDENFFDLYKDSSPIKLVNGGNGTQNHPTQALLDVFTMTELGIELENSTITIMGDVKHSRVANSLIQLLGHYNCNILLCGPEECLPSSLLPNCRIENNIDECLNESDVVYALRIQKERHNGPATYYDSFHKDFGLTKARIEKSKKKPPVFHPGPVNIGVELSQCLIDSDFYKGYEQVKNSTFIRMAILETMLQRDK